MSKGFGWQKLLGIPDVIWPVLKTLTHSKQKVHCGVLYVFLISFCLFVFLVRRLSVEVKVRWQHLLCINKRRACYIMQNNYAAVVIWKRSGRTLGVIACKGSSLIPVCMCTCSHTPKSRHLLLHYWCELMYVTINHAELKKVHDGIDKLSCDKSALSTFKVMQYHWKLRSVFKQGKVLVLKPVMQKLSVQNMQMVVSLLVVSWTECIAVSLFMSQVQYKSKIFEQ